MSLLARFLLMESKDTLLEFLGNSVVQTYGLKTKTYGLPQSLAFEEVKFPTATKGSDAIPVYKLRNATPTEASFKSFICDYEDGAISYQILGKEAKFCFTWTMNGCTFGIGSPTKDGAVLVSHGNAKGVVEQGSTQAETQAAFAQALHGPGVSLFEPGTYRQGGTEIATTFGIREGADWSFYYQSFKPVGGGKMEHLGVFPITQGTTNL